jgi:DNA recombination protein RmuC
MTILSSVPVAAAVIGLSFGLLIAWFLGRSQRRALRNEAMEREGLLTELRTEIGKLSTELARVQEQASHLAELKRQVDEEAQANRALQSQIAEWRQAAGSLESQATSLRGRNTELDAEVLQLKTERERLLCERQAAELGLAEAKTNLQNERSQATEKLAVLNDARELLSNEFKALAGEILEVNSRRFTEQNRENIGQLLTPLREKITEFQAKVEDVQKEGIAGRSELKEQIGHLKTLNERLSQDATNLVSALKGSSRVQGEWGEHILESLLDGCGLQKGREYFVQETVKRQDGKSSRLDVLVNLPAGRHLIIDSKVSLGDYAEYCNAEVEASRNAALKRHLISVRAHLRGLSERDYQSLYGLNSLDFVIMFVPIEPAFMLAIAHDSSLWNEAWHKNVLLVSPSTLLFVIRTVAHLWKQEKQTKNVLDIAQRGGDLYDKFVGFVDDLKSVGARLTQAKTSYDDAFGKLSTGPGNLVRQAELLKKMGIKAKKRLPEGLAAASEDGEELVLESSILPSMENE